MMPGHAVAEMDLQTFADGNAVRAKGVVGPLAQDKFGAHVSGVVTTVQCDTGMHVEAGQACAEIDPRPYQAAVDLKTAELRAAEGRLESDQKKLGAARVALERAEAAASRRRSAGRLRRSVERLEALVERDKTGVSRAQEALAAATAELAQTRIVSPAEGTIRERNVAPGQKVSAETKAPLFVVAPSSTHIDATVDAEQSSRISVGDKVVVTVDALPNLTFSGTVAKIEPPRGDAGASVDIETPDPDHVLEPGMKAAVRILAQ
ncbi:MAG: efflux RND transporter periplasmic adaptor subunit [Methylocystis sp.]